MLLILATNIFRKNLNDGDTEIYVNDISRFQLNENTTSRNVYSLLFDVGYIDIQNNKTTLKNPWNNGKVEKGTKLSQKDSGSSIKTLTSEWKTYQNSISGANKQGDSNKTYFDQARSI